MTGAGCVICGRPAAIRVDLTVGSIDPRNPSDYAIEHLLRAVLVCGQCEQAATLGTLLREVGGGVAIVRGCLVQCNDTPPWHLRFALPGGPRWRKVVCPSCGGRATVQHVGEVVDRPESAWRGGLRQVLEIMSFRNVRDRAGDELYDADEMDYPARAGGAGSQAPGLAGDHDRRSAVPALGSAGAVDAQLHTPGQGHRGEDEPGDDRQAIQAGPVAIDALDLTNYES